jgi:hypothetical protein
LLRTMNCLELQSLLAPPPDLKALGNIGSTWRRGKTTPHICHRPCCTKESIL